MRIIKSLLVKKMEKLTDLFTELASTGPCYPKISFGTLLELFTRANLKTEDVPEDVRTEATSQLSRTSSMQQSKATMAKTPKAKPCLTEVDIAFEFAQTCLASDQLITLDQIPKEHMHVGIKWMREHQYEIVKETK